MAGAGFILYQEVEDSSEVITDKGYYYVSDDGSLVEITTSSSVPAGYSGVYYKFISMPTITEGDTTGVNNKFAFTSLGIGNYVLMETTTPDGYNTMEDIYFTVSATTGYTGGTASVKTLQANVTSPSGSQQSKSISVEASTLSLYTTIQNSSSYVMPSGGGIGTTVFYVVGGVMIVGAGMLLITKRRMRSKK
ncbi:MAG: prealbumin-like fold domain-containing protein [Ruminococcus sp.]|nr:prealbumin-like fold domain-containing protein [Ruminococcus sp.]